MKVGPSNKKLLKEKKKKKMVEKNENEDQLNLFTKKLMTNNKIK